jgi:Fe-Mn family superoxide dismutase
MFYPQNLKFESNALEPFMSENTINFHYGKHYKGYIDKLNELIANTKYENMTLKNIIVESFNNLPDSQAIFNNAAQVWNHEFFWHCLSLSESEKEDLSNQITLAFGNKDNFNKRFKELSLAQFGSGWCWFVKKDNQFDIIKTSNAENPLIYKNCEPLFCIDVWEHAYYLDYQNRRADFVDAILNNFL